MIRIGTETFTSQKAARQRAGQVLHSHELWTAINGRDDAFVRALFSHHPCAGTKAGVGVSHFIVGLAPYGYERALWVVRTDGTGESWSIKKAVAAAVSSTPEEY